MLVLLASDTQIVLAQPTGAAETESVEKGGNANATNDAAKMNLKITIDTGKKTYNKFQHLEFTTTIENKGSQPVELIMPMGNDIHGMYTYEVTQTSTGKRWVGREYSPQSFASDIAKAVTPGGKLVNHESSMRFEADAGLCALGLESLPVGDYKVLAVYDGQRTFYPKNARRILLKSEPVEFSIVEK